MSAGWRISEENFMKNISWINNFKLRASWGQLGNHRIYDYMYIQRISLGQNYDFGGSVVNGAATVVASNKDISWEKTTEFDLGADVDFFHNKLLSVSVDYYNRYTKNILTDVPVSLVFGLAAPVVNGGAMRNKGIEFQLEHNYKVGDFQYSVAFNATYNENKVEKYLNPSKGDRIYMEGISWGSFYGYESTGIFQTDTEASASPYITGIKAKAGDLIYKDQNGDGKIDGDDRIVLGNSIPEITFGCNINLKYRNFDLSALFQGASNVYRTLGEETFWPFDPENALSIHLDRTTVKDGQIVKQGHYPRTVIGSSGSSVSRVQSSFTVLNASYLRMKNIQLGYNLPVLWLKAVKIEKARAYISGQNLLTFTGFPSSFDPELGSSATYSYPQVKFYTIGIDVTF
jgi:TonB-linked SusC/RagA family outer membrane protein